MKKSTNLYLFIIISLLFITCDVDEYNLCMDDPLHSTLFGIRIIDSNGNDIIYEERNNPLSRVRLYIEPEQKINAIRFITCDETTEECTLYIENISYDFDNLSEAAPFLLTRNFFDVDTLQFQVEKTVNSCDNEYFNIIDIKKGGQSLDKQDNVFIIKD